MLKFLLNLISNIINILARMANKISIYNDYVTQFGYFKTIIKISKKFLYKSIDSIKFFLSNIFKMKNIFNNYSIFYKILKYIKIIILFINYIFSVIIILAYNDLYLHYNILSLDEIINYIIVFKDNLLKYLITLLERLISKKIEDKNDKSSNIEEIIVLLNNTNEEMVSNSVEDKSLNVDKDNPNYNALLIFLGILTIICLINLNTSLHNDFDKGILDFTLDGLNNLYNYLRGGTPDLDPDDVNNTLGGLEISDTSSNNSSNSSNSSNNTLRNYNFYFKEENFFKDGNIPSTSKINNK